MKAAGIKEKQNNVIVSGSLRNCCLRARGRRENELGRVMLKKKAWDIAVSGEKCQRQPLCPCCPLSSQLIICYEFLIRLVSPVSSNTLSAKSIKRTPLWGEMEMGKKHNLKLAHINMRTYV